MANGLYRDLIYGLNKQITGTGSLGIGNVKDESKVRFAISQAGPANVIRIRARIIGQESWVTLTDLEGNVNIDIDVFTWDQIEVICLVFDTTTNIVKIVATSFDSQAGTTYQLPDSSEVEGAVVSFTSNDNSVNITGNPALNQIDFSVPAAVKYVQAFNATTNWTLNVDKYDIIILESTHQRGASPFIEVLDGLDDVVQLSKNIDVSGNIVISVSSTPDLRFAGKVIIL
jgi:hypothetical protein